MPTILVVDDDFDVVESLVELVETFGFDALRAYDGKQGIESFLANEPAAVISDISMPVMNGHELARAIRSMAAGHKTPLIALTANNMRADVELSKASGFSIHLSKPVDYEKLEAFLIASVTSDE